MDRKHVAGIFLSLYGGVAMASCPYALNATAAQISQYGAMPFPIVSGQSVAFTVQDNASTPFGLRYGAGSSAGAKAYSTALRTGVAAGDVKLPATGIAAIEFKVDSFAASAPSSNPAGAGIGFGVSTGNVGNNSTGPMLDIQVSLVDEHSGVNTPRVLVTAKARNSTGTPIVYAQAQSALSLPLPPTYRLGLYFNRSTGRIGYTVNGVDQGYLSDATGNPLPLPSGLSAFSIGLGGSNMDIQPGDVIVGAYIGGTLITDAALMNQPYPSGTTDVCAVPLGR